MDNTNILLRIIEQLMQKSQKVSELAEINRIELSEVWSYVVNIARSGLENKFEIEVYDEDKLIEDIIEPERDNKQEQYDKIKDYEILLYYNDNQIGHISRLSSNELWALYDLLNNTQDEFVKFAREKVSEFYKSEFQKFYDDLSARRIIKKNINVFKNIDTEVLLSLYDAIEKRYTIDLQLTSSKFINAVSPINVYYDDDIEEWYLQYVWKKQLNIISLDKISVLNKSVHVYNYMSPVKSKWGWGKEEHVSFKLYDEKNAKDAASRYLFRKDIIEIKNNGGYFQFTVKVRDTNAFKRWVRGMGPQVVIDEPLWLKEEMRKEILKWSNNYLDVLN